MIDVYQCSLADLLILKRRPVKVIPDAQYAEIGVYSFGRGIFHKQPRSGLEVGDKELFLIKEGDFILQVTFAWEGAVGLATVSEDGMYGSVRFPTFRVDENRCFPPYLVNYFRTPAGRDQLINISPGSAGRNRVLNLKRLSGILVPLPPLEEQQRIVARIEELADKIEEARGLRREAVEEVERLVATTISRIFSKGTKDGWSVGRLGDYVIDDCYGTSEKTTDDRSGVPILRMGNIQNGRLDLHDLKYLHLSERERSRLLLIYGDILVNRTNSAELVGKCAVFDFEGEYSFASYLIRLRLDAARADPKLVALYINSPAGRNYMFNERKQMTGQANVNATKLKALPIVLPSLQEQQRIVAYLDELQAKVDVLKQVQAETQAELDALLPSVLDRAFRGELV